MRAHHVENEPIPTWFVCDQVFFASEYELVDKESRQVSSFFFSDSRLSFDAINGVLNSKLEASILFLYEAFEGWFVYDLH